MVWGAYQCVTVIPSDGWFMKLRLSVLYHKCYIHILDTVSLLLWKNYW
jgi:hypothetical protein